MKKVLVTILLLFLVLAACKKSNSSQSSGLNLLSSDDTKEVIDIITEANNELKKVKTIYKANQNRVDEELIPAMTAQDIVKAKSITDDFVVQINEGLVAADEAVKKIEKAENMDINDTYKEYLRLKREALQKQIAAFELRHNVAKLLRDSLGSNDTAKITQAQSEFKANEVKFHDLMEEGKGFSEEANQVFKDSLKKK